MKGDATYCVFMNNLSVKDGVELGTPEILIPC